MEPAPRCRNVSAGLISHGGRSELMGHNGRVSYTLLDARQGPKVAAYLRACRMDPEARLPRHFLTLAGTMPQS
jgi:hypothetical protein